jgi:hypothetical protein
MGEVYRARDTKLNRDVAIKVLPDLFVDDAERLARFTREAQTLASLNHPNIAIIHGLEPTGDAHALVMELVPGEDLSQRIARGAIPVDEALQIAKQIAEALEAAHEQGIIHRDLKPANIKVRGDGTVKVLDFGLAKAMEPIGRAPSVSLSPTITTPAMTQAGIILGTAAYMSPEQARGRAVDRRADIWAFGVVLFEMLTARRAFEGDDIAITVAAVMMKEPDWLLLPASVPPALRALLTRCLKKDPKARMRDIGDARVQIEELIAGAPETGVTTILPPPPLWRRVLPWAFAGVLAIALVLTVIAAIGLYGAREIPTTGPVQFTIVPPDNTSFGGPPAGGTGIATQVAVSPDGRNIVFVAGGTSGYQLWLRPVGIVAARLIPGTEGGAFPFWSPDSRFVGFFAGGKLKKVEVGGGPPTVLCDAAAGRGGSWNRDDVIVFAPGTIGNAQGGVGTGLMRVSGKNGGMATVVTTVDPAIGEMRHRWPHFLPDGRHFFYTEIAGPGGPLSKPSVIRIGSLDQSESATTLFQAESSVSYASGHLIFARDGTLMAQPFDPDTRQSEGDAFPLVEYVSREGSRYVGASVSENGTLVYAHDGSLSTTQLTWFDRTGRALSNVGDAAPYENLSLSDEGHVAFSLRTGMQDREVWITDIARGLRNKLTVSPGSIASPVWSPDGARIAFQAQRAGKVSLRYRLVNRTGDDESLIEASGNIWPSAWSADGRFILYTLMGSFPFRSDIWVLPLFGDRKPFPLVETAFTENSAVFSPNGRWVAYTTNEDGQFNVYVQPFLRAGGKYRVSKDSGSHPVWRADGKELFYLAADRAMMAIAVDTTREFTLGGVPQTLFPTLAAGGLNPSQVYGATKDGSRFLINTRPQQNITAPLTVLVNWTATIQK